MLERVDVRSFLIVTQYEVEVWLRIESTLGKKVDEYKPEKDEVMVFASRVHEAQRTAIMALKGQRQDGRGARSTGARGQRRRGRDEMDQEDA